MSIETRRVTPIVTRARLAEERGGGVSDRLSVLKVEKRSSQRLFVHVNFRRTAEHHNGIHTGLGDDQHGLHTPYRSEIDSRSRHRPSHALAHAMSHSVRRESLSVCFVRAQAMGIRHSLKVLQCTTTPIFLTNPSGTHRAIEGGRCAFEWAPAWLFLALMRASCSSASAHEHGW